jgi:hypothetical protein
VFRRLQALTVATVRRILLGKTGPPNECPSGRFWRNRWKHQLDEGGKSSFSSVWSLSLLLEFFCDFISIFWLALAWGFQSQHSF